MTKNPKNKFISTSFISFANLFRYGIEFLLQMILAKSFGVGNEIDAYFAAWLIPSVVIFMFITTLRNVLLPTFIDKMVNSGESAGWALISSLINSLTIIILFLTLFLSFTSKFWLNLVVPGLNPETMSLANTLSWYLNPAILLSAIISVLEAIFYAYEMFLQIAISVVSRAAIYVISVIIFLPILGIKGLAVGMLLSLSIHISVLILFLIREKKLSFYRFDIDFRQKEYFNQLKLWLVLLLLSFMFRMAPIIERFFASSLDPGSITYVSYATTIINLLTLITSGSLGIIVYASTAELVAKNDWHSLSTNIVANIRASLYLTLPFFILLMVFREQGITFLFERGEFLRKDTLALSSILIFYSGIALGPIITNITSNVLYSLRSIKFLALQAFSVIIMQYIITKIFTPVLGLNAVPLGRSISIVLSVLLHLFYLNIRVPDFFNNLLLQGKQIWKILLSASSILLLGIFTKGLLVYFQTSQIIALLTVLSFSVLSIGVYVFLSYRLGIPEAKLLLNKLQTKRGK